MSRDRAGTWTGPGLLALVDGEWMYYDLRDAPRDLRKTATALVGTDRPRIEIRLVKTPRRKIRRNRP